MHPNEFTAAPHERIKDPGEGLLSVRWLGTAGYELRAEGTTLLIDPYLTRVGLWRFLTRRIGPDTEAIDKVIEQADAILVGHSHFDHVMDVPYIAHKTGAVVYGSRSTTNLMAAAGLPESQVVTLDAARPKKFAVGPFEITPVPSIHSTFALGGKVPYAGEIPCSCEFPIRGKHYRCGDVFSYHIAVGGLTAYHLGSANLVEDTIAHKDGVDLMMVCIAARYATDDFTRRALDSVRPRIVMPMHYDNFFRSTDKAMKLLPRTRFGRFVDDVSGFDKEMTLRTLPLLGTLEMSS